MPLRVIRISCVGPNSWPPCLERKKLYIDENLFVGSMAGTVNGIYTYPEWNIDWMKDDNTVEKCKDPEDKRVNQWALDYWEKTGTEATHTGDLREEVRF